MIKLLAMLILCTGMAYGYSEEAPKLSPADQAAIDKAIESSLNEPSKAYQAYQAILTKASEKAIKDLEKLKAGAMKGNNLPLAVAIDGKIAEVKKGALGSEVVGRFEKTGDLLGDDKKVDVIKMVIGKWKNPSGHTYEFYKDGTGVHNWGSVSNFNWKSTGNNVYSIVFPTTKLWDRSITINEYQKDATLIYNSNSTPLVFIGK